MRKICNSELPENYAGVALIKSRARNAHYKRIVAVQKTLEHCRSIRSEFESELDELKLKSKRDGFSAGFEIFLEQFISVINLYNKRRKDIFSSYKEYLRIQLEYLLFDPDMVEVIISKIQNEFYEPKDKEFMFIFPEKFRSVFSGDINCLFTDGFDITLKNSSEIIRFPYGDLCEEIFKSMDCNIPDKLNDSFKDTIDCIIRKLKKLKCMLPD
ncbi:TPA: hypothetical protein J1413_004863 [Escherichia coli]|nr:hypothetical protein [Escherichia coli]HBA9523023.1 hypothetical protein [Escherichia coli]HBA9550978.1 hypothetical protein [Escherichia coli]HBA9560437.1 hypothetical protein [Escherichia coli]